MKQLFLVVTVLALAACGGGSGDDSDDFVPLDPTVNYDISAFTFGTAGVARTLSGQGIDSDGDLWTIERILTTRTTPDPAGPCLLGETQQDDALTLVIQNVGATTTGSTSCYTTAGIIQSTFELVVTDSPVSYEILTAAGNLPTTARIGAGGLLGAWNEYSDTNGDGIYDAAPGDTFTGSSTSNWRLEDQRGRAAFVITGIIRDEFGTQIGSEIDTYYITPSGAITGFEIFISLPGLEVTLSGTVS